MRTRRSPRNQDRLSRALGPAPTTPPPPPAPRTDAEIDAMWWVPKRSRAGMKRDAAQARQASPKAGD